MVAAMAPGVSGLLWRRLAGVGSRVCRGVAAGSGRAWAAVVGALGMVVAVRAVIGLGAVAYGAWLAYPPAGFIVAGVLLIADRLADERKESA